MLSLIGKKFYLFWSVLLIVFPTIIHLFWLNALYTTEAGKDATSKFIGYFPILFQYTSFLAFSSLFFSTLSFMFALRLVKGFDKYSIPGFFILIISFYLLAINIWQLI